MNFNSNSNAMRSFEPRNAQKALASEKEGTAMPRDNYDYPGKGT